MFDTTHKTFGISLNEKWMFLFPLHINIIYINTNINININITYIKINIQSNCSVRLSQPHITSWCTVHNTHSFGNIIRWYNMKDNITVLRHCNITTWNTILQYNNIAELENCNFRTLQHYNFTTLQHYKITTLPHYNITEGCLL